MQLMMYVGNDLIASIRLERESISQPGYLGKIKRSLLEKYSDELKMTASKPEFLVVDLPTPEKATKSAST